MVQLGFVLFFLMGAVPADASSGLVLAEGGQTSYAIVLPDAPSAPEEYAAQELASYLRRMSGAEFPVTRGEPPARAVVLRTGSSAGVEYIAGDAYAITVRGDRIYLTGGSPRAVLYAAYDVLERLGCRWIAPEFSYYEGTAERVPKKDRLTYSSGTGDVVERPTFTVRKLDTGGARSHTIETVQKQITWMAKLRFNTLMVSMTAGLGAGVTWDDWRDAIVPELERRGMLLQVGGHGYQNFLNAEMEDGALFERHPEWFGRDENCKPRKQAAYVFNTGNEDAVAYLIDEVIHYLKARPEIDIFGFWPPDMARWADCADFEALGAPQDRQGRLVRQLHEAMKREVPDVRLEMIAYEHALEPPAMDIPADVLVDFCPLSQNFDVPIYDPSSRYNRVYADALAAWREAFPGAIGLYSYYRKCAWRSLPNLIPAYIQQELKWYASIPLQAVSSYAEPDDWFTYEVNHYALGRLAWNPWSDVDRLIGDYAEVRFGRHAELARDVVAALEQTFRTYGSIPYSDTDSAGAIAAAREDLRMHFAAVRAAAESAGGAPDAPHRSPEAARRAAEAASLDRLALMLEFALRDLEIQHARAGGSDVDGLVRDLVAFLTQHSDRGVFLVYGRDDVPRYLKHYTRDWSEVAPGAGI